jgi:two-component system cell cycle sensor histidine kinase/response regulator CckA
MDVHERRFAQASVAKAQRLEAVGRLAGGIAHDFNNLLQVMLGHTERVQQGLPADSPVRDSVAEIRAGADRAAALTDRLLSLGQRQLLELEPVDLDLLLQDLRELLQARAGAGVRLALNLAERPARVRADRARLVHVLKHLVDNAREAMPRGGELSIGTERITIDEVMRRERPWLRPGPYMRLIVQDSGPGMDAGTAALVFEPFFTTKPRGTGAGLGLAAVYGLVKQNNGFVWIESRPGTGTRAVVLLPAEGAARAAEETVRAPAVRRPVRTPRVLVVEDEPAVRDVLSIALLRHGFHVTAVGSAEEALPLAGDPFEILLTDISLPGMNGVQLARQLRHARPGTPILLMSGYAREEFLPIAQSEDDLPFIAKPFTTQAVVERLRSLLDGAPRQEASPS